MFPHLHCDWLDTGCFPCSAQNSLDPWNKVVPVEEICMHICLKYTRCSFISSLKF